MCPHNSGHRSHTGSRGRACANFGTILSTDPEAPLCARLKPPPSVHDKSWRSRTCPVGRADGVTGLVLTSNRAMTFEQ